MAAVPVQIDTVNGGEFAAGFSNAQQGAFLNNSDNQFYAVLTTSSGRVEVFTSTDSQTWTIEDEGNEPGFLTGDVSSAAYWYDGDHIITIAYLRGGGSGDVDIELVTFDTSISAYDPPIGTTGPPQTNAVRSLVVRGDGTIAIIGDTSGPPQTQVFAYVYDPGVDTWASFEVSANLATVPGYDATVQATAIDGTVFFDFAGIFYIFFETGTGTAAWNNNPGLFFQVFNADNSLGNFFVFPDQIDAPVGEPDSGTMSPIAGQPVLAGSAIIVPVGRLNAGATNPQYASLYVSIDGGASWTELDPPGMDAAAFNQTPPIICLVRPPNAAWDGSTLYCIYAQETETQSSPFEPLLRLCSTMPDLAQSPDTWTWTAKTVATIGDLGFAQGTAGFTVPSFKAQGDVPFYSTDVFTAGSRSAWAIPAGPGAAAGRFHGTYVGFMKAGQFGGGNQ